MTMIVLQLLCCFLISATLSAPTARIETISKKCNTTSSSILCPDLPTQCCCTRKHVGIVSGFVPSTRIVAKCRLLENIPKRFPEDTTNMILRRNNIHSLGETSFNKTQLLKLTSFEIAFDKTLESINAKTFSGLASLRNIYFENVENLVFVSSKAFQGLPKLSKIVLKDTGLKDIVEFTELNDIVTELAVEIEISHNKRLTKIQKKAFHNLSGKAKFDVKIRWNPQLRYVEDYAFYGSRIVQLNLEGNEALNEIRNNAFAGIKGLEILSLSGTAITHLPTKGLENLKILTVKNTPRLIRFPKSDQLPALHIADVTYPYHCCALTREDYGFGRIFQSAHGLKHEAIPCPAEKEATSTKPEEQTHNKWYEDWSTDYVGVASGFADDSLVQGQSSFTNATAIHSPVDDSSYIYDLTNTTSEKSWDIPEEDTSVDSHFSHSNSWKPETVPPRNLTNATKLCWRDKDGKYRNFLFKKKITCKPEPDLFNPCENLLGDLGLEIVSWSVACLAVLGNLFVIVVLAGVAIDRSRNQQRHLSVPKFLILNLAFADLCMGVYVLALSAMDRKSSGEYYKYGVEWQQLGGCDVSGFLSIFASQLSVFTLSVVSLERWYAIRYAIQLDKRMTIKCGRIVMLFGWLLALFLAALPLVGVNSYRKTAICLPMEASTSSGKAYVATLLSLDIAAFVVVVGSYVSMYAIVRTANTSENRLKDFFSRQQKKPFDESKGSTNCYGTMDSRAADARVAKRMAVLVFTDFACFFPICFFSLFALAELPLLTLSTAKVLLVACLPFNACCNPFLYAILTKSFRKDVKTFYQVYKCTLHGDDRRKVRRTEKRSEGGSRQEDRRKTLQVYVDGEAEQANGDIALVSMDHKNTSGAKTSSIADKSAAAKKNAHATCSFSQAKCPDSSKSLPAKSTSLPNSNSNNNSNSKTPGNASSTKAPPGRHRTLASTSSLSEDPAANPTAMLNLIASLPMSLFGKRKRVSSSQPIQFADTARQSFETQVSANGGVELCEHAVYENEVEVSSASKTTELDGEVKRDTMTETLPAAKTNHCEDESFI